MDRQATVLVRIEPGQDSSPSRRDRLASQLVNDLRGLSGVSVSVPRDAAPAHAKGFDAAQVETLVISIASSATAMKAFSSVLIKWIERTGARSVDVNGMSIRGYSGRDAAMLLEAAKKSTEPESEHDGRTADGPRPAQAPPDRR
jgi:hypothetical protein